MHLDARALCTAASWRPAPYIRERMVSLFPELVPVPEREFYWIPCPEQKAPQPPRDIPVAVYGSRQIRLTSGATCLHRGAIFRAVGDAQGCHHFLDSDKFGNGYRRECAGRGHLVSMLAVTTSSGSSPKTCRQHHQTRTRSPAACRRSHEYGFERICERRSVGARVRRPSRISASS